MRVALGLVCLLVFASTSGAQTSGYVAGAAFGDIRQFGSTSGQSPLVTDFSRDAIGAGGGVRVGTWVHPRWTLEVGAMNGDAKADLMYVRFSETHIVVLPGTSTGEFGTPTILDYGLPGGLDEVTSADIDGDSDRDVIALGREGEIIVFRNAGGGVFAPAVIGGTAIGTIPSPFTGLAIATGIATADANGDGKADFVACSTTLMRGISNGDGTFAITEDATSHRAASCGEIFLVDMNGDGHVDAVIKSEQLRWRLRVPAGTGGRGLSSGGRASALCK